MNKRQKPPKKMQTEWLDRTIVPAICYCLCTTNEMFQRELKRLDLPRSEWPEFNFDDDAAATTHFIRYRGRTVAMVCMTPQKRDIVEIHGLLCHEAVHIWQRTHEKIREEFPSHEFEAYSIQWISQQLMWAYRKQTTAKKAAKK